MGIEVVDINSPLNSKIFKLLIIKKNYISLVKYMCTLYLVIFLKI